MPTTFSADEDALLDELALAPPEAGYLFVSRPYTFHFLDRVHPSSCLFNPLRSAYLVHRHSPRGRLP